MNCESCGIPIGDKPEGVTWDMLLCDRCLARQDNRLCKYFHPVGDDPSYFDDCGNPEAGAYRMDCIGVSVCTKYEEDAS
jgi:hypothetical protein